LIPPYLKYSINMSDVPKPVEEQSAPVVEATSTEEPAPETKVEESTAAAEETSPAAEPPVEAVDTVEPAAVTEEAPAPAAVKEFAGEGIVGYKAPSGFTPGGLMK
jgi:hypothetical protein